MENKNWIKRHPVWTGIIGFVILTMIVGMVVPNNCDCPKTYEKELINLEEGFIRSCNVNKLSGASSLATLDLLEVFGYYEASIYRSTFEEMSHMDCYQLMNDWKSGKIE